MRRGLTFHQASSIEHGGPYQEAFARYGVRCAILPVQSPAAERLTGDGWKVRYSDEAWAVLGALPDQSSAAPLHRGPGSYGTRP